MSILTKTIKLRLYPSNEQKLLLDEMSEQYRLACNYVSETWFNNTTMPLKFAQLCEIFYYDLRKQFNLKSQMASSVIKTVIARYKTAKEQLKQNPYPYQDDNGKYHLVNRSLDWLTKPIYFTRPQVDLVNIRDFSFKDNFTKISLNTLEGRTIMPFESKHFGQYINNPNFKLGTGKIVKNKNKYYFHVPITFEIVDFDKANVKHVVGIDRGLRFLMTTYDEKGNTTFFSGKEVQNKRNQFAHQCKELQAKCTKSAKRALKRLSARENSFMTNVNHNLSRALLNTYGSNTLFVMEDLTGVSFDDKNLSRSKKEKYNLRSWNFYQLEQMLIYKSNEVGSEILKVDAHYTSSRCPKCGTIHKTNRHHDKHVYICNNCGYQSNDDRIGAMNIYQLGTDYISGVEKPKFAIQKQKQLY